MALLAEKSKTDKQFVDDQVPETPDTGAPLRADVLGSIAGADPNSPGYLGKINHLITAHGAVDNVTQPPMGAPSMTPATPAPAPAPAASSVTSGRSSLDDALMAPTPTMIQPQQHRGWLGKIGHGLARMGNIAGDILAPGVMALTPGTDLNKRFEAAIKDRNAARDRELAIKETQAGAEKLGAETRAKLEPSEQAKNEAEAFKARLTPEAKTDFELWRSQNPGAPVSEWLKLVAENKPDKESKDDKDIADYIAANNLQNTPANREKARADIAKRAPTAKVAVEGTGSWMPLYDKDGKVSGAWDPKTGQVRNAPPNVPGTTSGGAAIASKADAAAEKKAAPLKAAISEVETARDLKAAADKGNAEADVGLVLAFFKAMRGATGPGGAGGGIRFTQQEQQLIMGARNIWGSLQVVGNKVLSNGEPLSRTQRQQVMDVIELYGRAAQRSLDELQGKKPAAADAGGGGETIEYVRDPATKKLVPKTK